MKFCEECGAVLSDDAKFCEECGTKVDVAAEEVATVDNDFAEKEAAEKEIVDQEADKRVVDEKTAIEAAAAEVKKESKKGLIIGCICGGVAVVGAVIVLFVTGVFGGTDMSEQLVEENATEKVASQADVDEPLSTATATPAVTSTATPTVTPVPTPEGDNSYVLEGSDSRFIHISDLKGMSKEELRYARNEIYARHGCYFKDESLSSFFSKKSWYKKTVYVGDFDESELNAYEKANLKVILRKENGVTLKDGTYMANLEDAEWYIYVEKTNGGKSANIQILKNTMWEYMYSIYDTVTIKNGKITVDTPGTELALGVQGNITIKKDYLKCQINGSTFTAQWVDSDTPFVKDLESHYYGEGEGEDDYYSEDDY